MLTPSLSLMLMRCFRSLFAAVVLLAPLVLHAQSPAPEPGGAPIAYYLPAGSYRPTVPSPEQFLGWRVGQRHISHDLQVAYMRALAAAAPDRIALREYARTHELRPLLLLTITSAENHQRLEAIRQAQVDLADPDKSGAVELSTLPAVVYMGFSVHGNEASGANAALLMAYYLAAAEGPSADSLRAQTVILFDPCFNPDGVNRFASWVNSHRSKSPSPDMADREHNEAWPGGRTNHYWFDLNRDWMPLVHPESQGRIATYHQWKPDILTDHHEMGTGSTFFFQPGIPSGNNPLTPQATFELTNKIAAFHARAFDRLGSLYFTREAYDDYYIGKGSSYPDINGGIGILFEQASSRGHLADSPNGPMSFAFTIRNQVTAAFSTLAAARALRLELKTHKRNFYREALELGRKDPDGHYVFGSATHPHQADALAALLRKHDIRVVALGQEVRAGGKSFGPGSYAVPLAQPNYRFAKSLFSRPLTFTDSIFYDISAWTLPLAFGVESASTLTLPASSGTARTSAPAVGLRSASGKAAYAYVIDWRQGGAPRALATLQAAGYRVKAATRSFSTGERSFGAGTLVLAAQQMAPGAAHASALDSIGRSCGVEVLALATGLTEPMNLGSSDVRTVEPPKAALLVSTGVNANDAGEIWYVLDARVGLPPTLLPRESFIRNLDAYRTLIVPDGNYPTLSESERNELRAWLSAGNTIVAYAGGAKWLADSKVVTLKFAPAPRDTSNALQRPHESLGRTLSAQRVPGSILEATLDPTHPLCFGYAGPTLAVFRENNLLLERAKGAFANPLVYSTRALLAGYLPRGYEARVSRTAAVAVQGVGQGRVIAAMDNPVFRAFWQGTERLLVNAVFYAQLISPASAPAEEE